MRRQQQSAIPAMIAVGIGATAVVAIVVYVANQQEAGPPVVVPKMPAVVAAPKAPAGPTPQELAKQEADLQARRQAAEYQAKLAAIPEPRPDSGRSIPGNAVPRDQFQADVMGKTPQQVIDALGRPDSSNQFSDGSTTWAYRRRSYDPIVGKPDFTAILYFENGIVSRVAF